jgi:hypothetical protein
MKMIVTCKQKIWDGHNRKVSLFGFGGSYKICIDASNFGQASDIAVSENHVPLSIVAPNGNFISVPQTDDLFLDVLPSSQWPPELIEVTES